MKARSAVVYSVLRLLAFLVPFGILMLFPIFRELYWLAAIFAALIGLSLSLLFLRRPLTEVTSGLAQRRERSRRATSDEDVEDAAADATATDESVAVEDRIPGAQPASADERPHQERPVGD